MRTPDEVLHAVASALRAEPRVDAQSIELMFEEETGALVMDGEVADVSAKKLALEAAAAVTEVLGVVDRLHARPAERQDDATVSTLVVDALIQEPAFAELALAERVGNRWEPVRDIEGARGRIAVAVADGVVTLDGGVPGLDYKRLAGVLAWWVPGSRDVVNGMAVDPEEEDNDAAITDAVRIALEKDPFVDAMRVGVGVHDAVVTLTGMLDSAWQRDMAEFDAWYVFAVDRVVNRITVAPAEESAEAAPERDRAGMPRRAEGTETP